MEDVKVEEKVVTPVEEVEEKVVTPVEDEEINNKIERPVEVEKSYMDIPAVLTNVAARTKVQLVEYVGNELYMRTKEGAERFKNITNYIKDNITGKLFCYYMLFHNYLYNNRNYTKNIYFR